MLTFEEGRQCKILNVLETLVQEEKMALAPIVRVVASSQFFLTVFAVIITFFLLLHTIDNANITYATNTSYNTTNYYLQHLQLPTILK